MKIPTLTELIKDSTPEDFEELENMGLPFTNRALSAEDFRMPAQINSHLQQPATDDD